MNRALFLLTAILHSATAAIAEPKVDAAFFDGKSLDGWTSTNMNYWSVKDGAIVGHSDAAIPHNVFIWGPSKVRDFHLSVDVKITPDDRNAGIQFRSLEHGEFEAFGYQADIGKTFWGRLYHESGRQKLDWRDRGEKAVKPGDWNKVEILAVGDRIWTAINGTLAVSVREPAGEREGKIAFQIHSGPPFTIHYRNPTLTHDPPVTLAGLDEKALDAELIDLPPPPAKDAGADTGIPKFRGGFQLAEGDVVAFLGGTDTVRLSETGYLESLLTASPQAKGVRFRDLAWQADTVFTRQRPLNFPSLPDLLQKTRTSVVIAHFGQMEALAGTADLGPFLTAYEHLLDEISHHTEKIVLVTPKPFAQPASPHVPDHTAKNADVEAYAAAVRNLAAKRGFLCIDLSSFPTEGLAPDGIHLGARGHWELAREMASQLLAGSTPSQSAVADDGPFSDPDREALRQAILTKNLLWKQHWRPTNWAFAFGDRSHVPSSHDHRPGMPRWFPAEIASITALLDMAESQIANLRPIAP